MKNIFIALACLFIFTSCREYTAKYPVSEKSESISYQEILGKWKFISHKKDTSTKEDRIVCPHSIIVYPLNKQEFILERIPPRDSLKINNNCLPQCFNKHFKEPHLGRGWISKINNESLINLKLISSNENDTASSFTYHLTINQDTIIVKSISKRLFNSLNIQINSIEDHKKFIKKALKNPSYWNQEYRYIK
tara:strand:- start:53 stop:628 length:576 start_codon:yes stop_codon:yes gene_type:complete